LRGFDDNGNGISFFNFSPVLFAVILFDQAQYKQALVGGINLNESNISVVNTMSLRDDILEAMESIRPANVVVDSLLGYAETKLPDSLITIKFQSTKNINITSASQLN